MPPPAEPVDAVTMDKNFRGYTAAYDLTYFGQDDKHGVTTKTSVNIDYKKGTLLYKSANFMKNEKETPYPVPFEYTVVPNKAFDKVRLITDSDEKTLTHEVTGDKNWLDHEDVPILTKVLINGFMPEGAIDEKFFNENIADRKFLFPGIPTLTLDNQDEEETRAHISPFIIPTKIASSDGSTVVLSATVFDYAPEHTGTTDDKRPKHEASITLNMSLREPAIVEEIKITHGTSGTVYSLTLQEKSIVFQELPKPDLDPGIKSDTIASKVNETGDSSKQAEEIVAEETKAGETGETKNEL